MNIVTKAARVAFEAHSQDERKWMNEPYIMHPMRVSGILTMYGYDQNLIAAGWLHDVVEDHSDKYTFHYIKTNFNNDVAALCEQVTNLSESKPEYRSLPRRERKKMDREHICRGSERGQILKAVDRYDNIKSCYLCDNKKWFDMYVKETILLVEDLIIPPFLRKMIYEELDKAKESVRLKFSS